MSGLVGPRHESVSESAGTLTGPTLSDSLRASMAKLGRNDACRCGSGKKYKKCCLRADEQLEASAPAEGVAEPRRSAAAVAASVPPEVGLSPYVVAKIATDPRSAGDSKSMRRIIERLKADRWTLEKVAAMSTSAILDQLRSFGVETSRDRFAQLAAGRASAWSLSDDWLAGGATCRGVDQDFLGMAACELWKRFVPDPPSVEMLDDWMQDGYRNIEDGEIEAACDVWWKTWSALRTHVLRPAMTTMHAADAVFRGSQSIFNWSQDFQMELHNAALDEERFNAMGRQYAEEWLAQFSGESQTTELNFRQFHAELVARSGDVSRALELFEQLPARWPDDVWAHVYAGDAHAGLFLGKSAPRSPERALALYTRARELASDPDDREAVDDRIASLADRPHAKRG